LNNYESSAGKLNEDWRFITQLSNEKDEQVADFREQTVEKRGNLVFCVSKALKSAHSKLFQASHFLLK
jgi:hypothetical protein